MYDWLITGDSHFGLVNDSWIDDNGIESKTNEICKQFDYMIDFCIKKKIKKFFHMGDLYHSNRPIPMIEEMVIQRLNRLEENGIETYIVMGNHDASNSRRSSLAPLTKIQYNHVNVYEKVTGVDVSDSVRVIFIPHVVKSSLNIKDNRSQDMINQYIKEEVEKNLKPNTIIMGHIHYKGASTGSEQMILQGGINFFPDISKKNIKRMFFGHIHKFQLLKYGNVDVIYPGSIVYNDFGERKDNKGFILYDSENDNWEFEKLNTTQYKQINIDLINKDHIELSDEKIKKSVNDKIVKLVINISEENRKKINIQEIEAAFSKYSYVSKIVRNIEKRTNKKIEKVSLNPEKMLYLYIDKNLKLPKDAKKEIYEEGLKIMKEVQDEN